MKILYITNGINGGGGLERVLSIKASYFAEKLCYDVHIITINDSEKPFYNFSPKIKIHNIITSNNKIKYLYSYITEINKIAVEIKADIISVCDDGLKGLYVPLWIKKGCASIIYERHASMRMNNSKLQSKLIRLGGHLYDKVVVLTEYNKSEWSSNNLVVIPNPLTFCPQESSSLSNKKIICVGSISHNKGYDLLIEAWEKIAPKFPDWSIYIYGKGDPTPYQKIIEQKKLTNRIIFCGQTQNILNKYMESSIFVLPSRSEGFGMVLIEAMACGLPCVSFDCPCGPRDIITDGYNGYLSIPENTKMLAEKISILIESESIRIEMGKHAKASIKKYDIVNISKLWENLFYSIQSNKTV